MTRCSGPAPEQPDRTNGTAITREEVATSAGIHPGAPRRNFTSVAAVPGLKPKLVQTRTTR